MMIYEGYSIFVEVDRMATNPRRWLNLGTLITSDYYNEVPKDVLKEVTGAASGDIVKELTKHFGDIAAVLPIYDLYSLERGKLRGFIFATKDDVREWFGSDRDGVEKELASEVRALECYVTGKVYMYHIPELGYIGTNFTDRETCVQEAKLLIDCKKGELYEYGEILKEDG